MKPVCQFIAATLIVILTTFFLGCQGQQVNWDDVLAPTNPEASVCALEGYEDSMICKATAELGLSPEDLHGLILDSTALGLILTKASPMEVQAILTFLNSTEALLGFTPTWEVLFAKLKFSEQDSKLLASILNRRLKPIMGKIDMSLVIGPKDLEMIAYHLKEMKIMLGGSAKKESRRTTIAAIKCSYSGGWRGYSDFDPIDV
jgi:hypothetical protein